MEEVRHDNSIGALVYNPLQPVGHPHLGEPHARPSQRSASTKAATVTGMSVPQACNRVHTEYKRFVCENQGSLIFSTWGYLPAFTPDPRLELRSKTHACVMYSSTRRLTVSDCNTFQHHRSPHIPTHALRGNVGSLRRQLLHQDNLPRVQASISRHMHEPLAEWDLGVVLHRLSGQSMEPRT